MYRCFLVSLVSVLALAGISVANPAAAAYSTAKLNGKAFCPKGTHFSARKGGECWSCAGRKRTLAFVTSGKACKRPAYNRYRKAHLAKPSGKIIKAKCAKGYKLAALKGTCYRCDRGWKRSTRSVKSGKACFKRVKAVHSRAKFVKKFGCGRGQVFSLRGGGQCWVCPRGTVRTLGPVNGPRACTNNFGEIFAANKGGMCRKVVGALRDGSRGVGKFQENFRKLTAPVTGPIKKAMTKVVPDINSPKALQKITRQLNKTTQRYQSVLDELVRVSTLVQRKPNRLSNVMLNSKVMCGGNPRKIQNALVKAGLNRNLKVRKAGLLDGLFVRSAHAASKTSRRVFHSVSVGADFVTNKLIGPTLSFTVVTDFHQNLHLYFSFGAVLATSAGYDRSVGYMIFPHASISDFAKFNQLGLELGFGSIKKYEDLVAKKKFACRGTTSPSGTVPIVAPKIGGCRWPSDVGIAVSFDPPVFKNFAANVPGIGLNWSGTIKNKRTKLLDKVDVSLSGDYSWKLLGK